MEEKSKNIYSLIKSFEARNELLEEEIKRNKKAIDEMKKELSLIEQDNDTDIKIDIKEVKVVA